MTVLRKYNQALSGATRIPIPARVSSGALATSSDYSPATGDAKVSIDCGTEANTGTDLAWDDGTLYLTLSGAELSGKLIVVRIIDAAIQNEVVYIETFGHASAMYPTIYNAGTVGNAPAAGDEMDLVDAPNATAVTAIQAGLASTTLINDGVMPAIGAIATTLDDVHDHTDQLTNSQLPEVLADTGAILEDTGTTIPALIGTAGPGPTVSRAVDSTDAILFDGGSSGLTWTATIANAAGAAVTAGAVTAASGTFYALAAGDERDTVGGYTITLTPNTGSARTLGLTVTSAVASGTGGGSGDIPVTHATLDTEGDPLEVVDGDGNGVDDVAIRAYVAAEWTNNPLTAEARGETRSRSDKTWTHPLMLDAGTYTIVYSKSGRETVTTDVEVS